MTEIRNARSRMREEHIREPVVTGGGSRIPFVLMALGAVVLGFVVVTFTPRIYSVQRTAALPDFRDAPERIENPARAMATPVAMPADDPARYAGKSFDEIGTIADGVCFQRAHALVPHWSKTPRLTTKDAADFADAQSTRHFGVLLQCLVTEAPARYCARGQRNMIKAEIIMYFRGIDHANATARKVVAEVKAAPRSGRDDFREGGASGSAPDDTVVRAIEGLMRDGYLTPAERGDIGTSVPPAIRDRFARVAGRKLPCPDPPWWATLLK